MMFKPNSPFYEVVNDKIGDLLAGGFIDYWIEENLNPKGKLKVDINHYGPQVLTMDHLEICFKACLVPMALSAVTFFLEIFIYFSQKYFVKNVNFCRKKLFTIKVNFQSSLE